MAYRGGDAGRVGEAYVAAALTGGPTDWDAVAGASCDWDRQPGPLGADWHQASAAAKATFDSGANPVAVGAAYARALGGEARCASREGYGVGPLRRDGSMDDDLEHCRWGCCVGGVRLATGALCLAECCDYGQRYGVFTFVVQH